MSLNITTNIQHPEVPRDVMKLTLQNLINNPFTLGNNQIKILKVSDKYVEIEELFNGYLQTNPHKYTIETAYAYWKYRTTQFESWPSNDLFKDVSHQSNQYRVQLENINELFIEIKNHLHLVIKEKIKRSNIKYKIEFNVTNIVIVLSSGAKYTIAQKLDKTDTPRTIVSYELSKAESVILSIEDFVEINVLNGLSQLLYLKDEISLDFLSVYSRYNMCQINLKKLWQEPVQDIDPILLEDLHNFIINAPIGHTYAYKLSPIGQYERRAEVNKITRIRTIITIIAESEDFKFIEFEDKISKVTQNIEVNTRKIGQLVEAHNY